MPIRRPGDLERDGRVEHADVVRLGPLERPPNRFVMPADRYLAGSASWSRSPAEIQAGMPRAPHTGATEKVWSR
jgi:hypothetical protein